MPLSIKNKWRLILGKRADSFMRLNKHEYLSGLIADKDSDSSQSRDKDIELQVIDKCLMHVYENDTQAQSYTKTAGSKDRPSLQTAYYLNRSKQLFPPEVFAILQKDAVANNKVLGMLEDDELVASLEPNFNLLTSILNFKDVLNAKALANAENIVRTVALQLYESFKLDAFRAFYGKRDVNARPVRTFRNLDAKRIIKDNLKHYQKEQQYIIPERLHFKSKTARNNQHYLYILLDQSGSMMSSYAHSSILASVFARIPFLSTKFLCYSTELVDYSDYLDDIVSLLFKAQLGGGTETSLALNYVEENLVEPRRTIVVLVSDLFDSDEKRMLHYCESLIESGVKLIVLPSMGTETVNDYNKDCAQKLANLGAHVGVLSPERLIDFVAEIVRQNN